jgi:hypothetical protein
MTKNSCYTYFAIKGDFNPDEITDKLNLQPSEKWNIGDFRKDGKTKHTFSLWEYGRCENYNVIVENQMLQTIDKLIPKIQELKEIKQKYDVSFTLEVVPTAYVGESTPALGANRKIIEFCYHTETDIDIDLYVYDSNDI